MANNAANGANLGFESELWRAADALRSNMDAAEYKHVVLGLIFLKYISDAFDEQYVRLANSATAATSAAAPTITALGATCRDHFSTDPDCMTDSVRMFHLN
jgi:type I restriction-modification system DNA methylase subunit